jgi:anti-repressor protein
MENLVYKSEKGNLVTTSVLVADKFEKRHEDVLRSIRSLECSSEFQERNFALMVENRKLPQGGATKVHHYIMTRDGFTFLAMGFTGREAAKFKEDYINAFNKMETMIKNTTIDQMICDPDFAIALLTEVKESRKKINELQPKALIYDQIANIENLKTVAEVAKLIGTGRNILFDFLRDNKIFMQNNLPYQQYMDLGYFQTKIITIDSINKNYSQPYFTTKGLTWITHKWCDHRQTAIASYSHKK